MRKKFLSMFIALTMLSTFIPMTVSADSDFDHLQYDNVYYCINYESETAYVEGCDSSVSDITVRDEINGYPVTYIGDNAFENHENLSNVSLSNNITGSCKTMTVPCFRDPGPVNRGVEFSSSLL